MGRAVRVECSRDIPLILEADALVVGGAFAGLAAASDLADARRKVVLIESETFLGHELSAWQRPWLRRIRRRDQFWDPTGQLTS